MKDKDYEILKIFCYEFDVNLSDLLTDSRQDDLVLCRKAFIKIARENLHYSNNKIAKILDRKKSTICNNYKTLPSDSGFNALVNKIKSKLEFKP